MGVSVREKTRGSNVWWVFVNDSGKRFSKLIGSKKQAKEVAGVLQAELTLGRLNLDTIEIPLLKDYAANWLELIKQTRRPSTHERYEVALRRHILPVLGGRRLDLIKRSEIRKLMLDLQRKNHSVSNIRMCRDVLSGIFGAAIDEEIIAANPVKDILKRLGISSKNESEIEPLNSEEVSRLLETCRRDFGAYYLFFLMACRTGMRLGELLGLEWGDVKWDENYILVQRSFKNGQINRPKNGMSRRVDLSNQLKQELLKWNDSEHSDAKLIFDKDGKYISQNSIRNVFKRLLKRAELPHKRIHDLRHTYASLLLSNGETPVYVKEQMGHSGIDITVNTYGHLIPGSNRHAVNRLDELCSENCGE